MKDMVQVLYKIGKFLLVMALIYFGLWALNQFGVIDCKTVFLQTAGLIPGLRDLNENYKLGSKRSILLRQREDDLKTREKNLADDKMKLAQARADFANEQIQWNRNHLAAANLKPGQTTTGVVVPGSVNQSAASDAKIKEYLTMLGKMKPKQAAGVIQKLPEQTVFTIFDQLNQYQVTKIMENLPEDYLAKLTQDRLNKYRNL
jgi:flagellar motility protein MotE (MotC chaperone)